VPIIGSLASRAFSVVLQGKNKMPKLNKKTVDCICKVSVPAKARSLRSQQWGSKESQRLHEHLPQAVLLLGAVQLGADLVQRCEKHNERKQGKDDFKARKQHNNNNKPSHHSLQTGPNNHEATGCHSPSMADRRTVLSKLQMTSKTASAQRRQHKRRANGRLKTQADSSAAYLVSVAKTKSGQFSCVENVLNSVTSLRADSTNIKQNEWLARTSPLATQKRMGGVLKFDNSALSKATRLASTCIR
jgi:hypothetical protein